MGLGLTLTMYVIFFIFQALYIFVPLLTVKGKRPAKSPYPEQGLSVLIPAYNETAVIKNCIQGSLHVDYRHYEVIIINDGSTDESMDLLMSLLHLEKCEKQKANKLIHKEVKGVYQSSKFPNVFVIDKDSLFYFSRNFPGPSIV